MYVDDRWRHKVPLGYEFLHAFYISRQVVNEKREKDEALRH
jgi:hypothetical protein